LEASQVKEAIQKSKNDSHILHVNGSGDGVGSQAKAPDGSEDKTIGTDEGTGAEQEKERKGYEEMTDADQNVSQEKSY
nr:hypothetical protein [Tanacetum cinerariifolium]